MTHQYNSHSVYDYDLWLLRAAARVESMGAPSDHEHLIGSSLFFKQAYNFVKRQLPFSNCKNVKNTAGMAQGFGALSKQ